MVPFVSPKSGLVLKMENESLVSETGEKFPVVKGIPRFVSEDNYAAAFGNQWKTFPKLQSDRSTQTSFSKDRLEGCLGFSIDKLKGKTVLETGCGAGRFTELLVEAGALVHSVDLSIAVETAKDNVGDHPNVVFAQADIYALPFPKASFDYVLCMGVVQHTPDPEKTIASLYEFVKSGGTLVFDHYRLRWSYFFNSKPLWRKYIKRLPSEKSMKLVHRLVDYFFPLHWKYRNNKIAWWLLHRISPLIEYTRFYPEMDYQWHYEMSLLESHDSLTDYYKHLRSVRSIRNTLKKLHAVDIQVSRGGNGVEARAKKP